MKKLFSIFTILTLASVTFLVSCKKDTVTTSAGNAKLVSLAQIDNDLTKINAKYTHSLGTAKTTQRNGAAWAVAGADVVAGVGAASETWEWCATGWGGFACGLVTTIAAATASYGMYVACNMVIDTNGMGHQKSVIINDVDHYTILNPYNNPYDSCGIEHNDWVKILCEKKTDLPLTYATLLFDSSDLTSNDLSAIAYDTAHIAYNGTYFISKNHILDSTGNVTLTPFINYEFANDSNLNNIMTKFFEGFSQITDQQSAMSFINDYENYFMNTKTGLSDAEIFGLLHGFSVGKYSYAMWYDAYNN